MTILDWLLKSMDKLRKAGVDSPRRDCLVLLEDLLGKDRSWVNAHTEFELNSKQQNILDEQIARRVKREPLAYIRDKAWFYGRFFNVSPDVLIPRPESESFVERLKDIVNGNVYTIVDIGTGSGCLAVTAKLELPKYDVIATDIDAKALQTAKANARKHKVKIAFLEGSLLESLSAVRLPLSTIFMANLPYVPDGLITSEEIFFEPRGALFSGRRGLDHYQKFFKQIEKDSQISPSYIFTESLESQHKEMIKLAKEAGYSLEKTEVLVQQFIKLHTLPEQETK